METMPMRTGSSLSWGIAATVWLGLVVLPGKLLPHQLEDLAVGTAMAWRQAFGDGFLVGLHVLARLTNQGPQLLRIGIRVLPQPLVQGIFLGDEVVAPFLCLVQRLGVARRAFLLRLERVAHGLQGFL